MSIITRFFKEEDGATAIEYGLIAALISVAVIVALRFLGGELNNTFNAIGNELKGANDNFTPATG